jgi:hypothetical protein
MLKRILTSFRRKYLRFKISELRRKIKLQCIEYKGGKCQHCYYDKCPAALTFHHLDPSQKDFGISSSGISRSFEKCKPELDKCILLCVRCHAELHAKEDEIQRQLKLDDLNAEKRKLAPSKIVSCDNCNVEVNKFASSIREHNFCSTRCKKSFHRNKLWISDEELKQISQSFSPKEISEKYNKALSTVYDRLKKLKDIVG